MTLYYWPNRTIIDVEVAQECGQCGIARFYFVNQYGETSCLMCATVRETAGIGGAHDRG
jgi:hypothetical protein